MFGILTLIRRIVARNPGRRSTGESAPQHPFSSLSLNPNEVKLVVDVGAFNGSVTNAAAVSYPLARIIAFEPTDKSAEQFKLNTAAFADRIDLRRTGLSEITGEGFINITTTGAANSVYAQSVEHQRQNPHVRVQGEQSIRLETLDHALSEVSSAVDVLKIDVEGYELNVLRGAIKTLKRTKFVILEISLARDENFRNQRVFPLFEFMRNVGFHLYSIIDVYRFDTPQKTLGMAQFDAIFCNNDL